MMTHSIPGLDLCESFYHETVRPVLETHFPGLAHAAGRLNGGSEVLGFDTPQSMDHDWGPANLTLFLADTEIDACKLPVEKTLADHFPHVFRQFPTDFAELEVAGGSRWMRLVADHKELATYRRGDAVC